MFRRLKAFRSNKGFTLVELMIVVAVIGILALVLLPKIGTIKTTAKQAGLDTNMRMAQAVVQSQISDYIGKGSAGPSDTGNISNPTVPENILAKNIASALSSASDTSQAIKDPFNSWSGANLPAAAINAFPSQTSPNTYAAIVDVTSSSAQLPTSSTNGVGVLYIDVYPSNGAGSDIWVSITPYDANGAALTNKQVIIKP